MIENFSILYYKKRGNKGTVNRQIFMIIIKMIVRDLFHPDVNVIIKTWILKSKFVNLHLEQVYKRT